MVDVHRYHEISESNHRVLNPLGEAQLDLLAAICELSPGQHQLDLACGKGEMLCRYAHRHGTTGVGVDIAPGCIAAAEARARELGVEHAVRFVHGDAGAFTPAATFDVVSCIGATWIGGGLAGTLELMRAPLRDGGWLLVGEVFWHESPPSAARASIGVGDDCTLLAGVLDRFEAAGLDLVEMVLADQTAWDRYAASQWSNVARWLAAHPDDPDAEAVRATRDESRRSYLEFGRRYLGWGVFVARPS